MDTPLRTRRKDLGLTLATLAERVGITQGQLSRIEREGRASLATAIKLEAVTGVSAADIAQPSSADNGKAA